MTDSVNIRRAARRALVVFARGGIDQRAGGLYLSQHPANGQLHRRHLSPRATELLALLYIVYGDVERTLGYTQRLGCRSDTALVERSRQDVHALPDLAQ